MIRTLLQSTLALGVLTSFAVSQSPEQPPAAPTPPATEQTTPDNTAPPAKPPATTPSDPAPADSAPADPVPAESAPADIPPKTTPPALQPPTPNTPPADDAPAPDAPATAPTPLSRLQASLANAPDFEGVVLTSARRNDEGVVVLEGTLAAEAQRAKVETEALKILLGEAQKGTLQGPFTRVDASRLKVVTAPPSAPAPPTVPPQPAPTEPVPPAPRTGESGREFTRAPLAAELQNNLPNVAGLEEINVFHAENSDEGTVRVFGVIPSLAMRDTVEQESLKALQAAAQVRPQIADLGPFSAVDASAMRTTEQSAVEHMLPPSASGTYVVENFDWESREARVVGMGTREMADRLAAMQGFMSVNTDGYIVQEPARDPVGAVGIAYADALDAMARYDGEGMVESAGEVVRSSGNRQEVAAAAWFLRAAGHIMQGQDDQARAALRVASRLDDLNRSVRYYTLERFQGPQRMWLERTLTGINEQP